MPRPAKDGPLTRWCAERSPPWTLQRLADALDLSREAVRQLNERDRLDRRTELALMMLAELAAEAA